MVLKKFCPKCGKETNKFYEGLCKECFINEKFKNLKGFKKVVIYRCKVCGRYSLNKKMLFNSLNDVLHHFVFHSKSLKVNNFRKEFEVKQSFIKIKWFLDDVQLFSLSLRIKLKPFKCQYCQMMLSGYRQAIIQIRTKRIDPEKIMEEILKFIDERNKIDYLSFVSKIERKGKKINLYIGSKKSAYGALKRIKNVFSNIDFKIKVSKKLMGYKKGKRLYLDTIVISEDENNG